MAGPRARPRVEPRKRPTQARAGALVDAILQAAAELLDRDGIEAYTTNTIAARAGVSIGSLYQYFPSKDAITLALGAQAAARLVDAVERAAGLPDWGSALAAMVRAAVRHQLDQPRFARALDAHEARLAALGAPLPGTARIGTALASVLARVPGVVDAQSAADDLMAVVRALCDTAGARCDHDAAALEARIVRTVAGYLGAPVAECEHAGARR